MSSGVVHKKVWLLLLLILVLVSILIFLLMDQINLLIEYIVTNNIHIIICMVLFLLWNRLPDIVEPATFWNHRNIFHSKYMLITLIIVIILLIIWIVSYPKISLLYWVSICLGYVLHLILDSGTKRGLS